MVCWYCCSALCTNNYHTILPDRSKVKKYRLLGNKDLQQKCTSILKTSGINFNIGYICPEHWSKGYRESTVDFSKIAGISQNTQSQKQIHTLKRKLNAAERIVDSLLSQSSQISRKSARTLSRNCINKSFPPQSKSPQCTRDNFTKKIIVSKKHH